MSTPRRLLSAVKLAKFWFCVMNTIRREPLLLRLLRLLQALSSQLLLLRQRVQAVRKRLRNRRLQLLQLEMQTPQQQHRLIRSRQVLHQHLRQRQRAPLEQLIRNLLVLRCQIKRAATLLVQQARLLNCLPRLWRSSNSSQRLLQVATAATIRICRKRRMQCRSSRLLLLLLLLLARISRQINLRLNQLKLARKLQLQRQHQQAHHLLQRQSKTLCLLSRQRR